VAALGTAPLVLLALGGLWLTLWRTVLRGLGAVFVVAGLLATAWERSPDAFISADGELAAVRIPGVGWAISREGGRSFVRDAWRRRWGGASATGFLSAEALAGGGADGFGCDGLGCVLRVRGRLLAMPTTPEAAIEDCERADLVVTGVRLRRPCPGSVRTIDLDVLRREGAFAVWLTDDGIRTRSVAEVRGRRPWTGAINGRKSPVRE
jgi:competence protein ComEC